jgi:peptidoglycan/xylan/chitin deacetylase (PgdA/CDA1 family)
LSTIPSRQPVSLNAELSDVGVTERLPILMYHGVGDDAVPEQRRYQMRVKDFADQVKWLAENGFRSASLDEWRRARARHLPLDGKRVMFTFDDGFRNFREKAWPILRDHGFGALMFVPSGHVGGRSDWDDGLWQPVPLLDWDEIAELQAQGVEFGSHTRSHALLTGLSPDEVVSELMRDKQELEHRLGIPVESVAYPYGAVDSCVVSLAATCGFVHGLTCAGRAAERGDRLLALPRLEVDGRRGLQWFKAMVSREGGFVTGVNGMPVPVNDGV